MSSSEEFDDIKKEVRSVLLGFPNGCSFTDFMKDYKNFVRPKLPYEKLGFSNEMECLRAMPDAVKISRSGNDFHLVGISDESTKHIKKMVSKQKNAKRKPVSRRSQTNYGFRPMSNPWQKINHVLPSQMSNHWQNIPPQMWNLRHRTTHIIPSQRPANAMQMQTQMEFRNENVPRGSLPMSMTLQRAYASGPQANVGGKKALPPVVVREIIDLVRKYASGLSFRDFFASYTNYYKKIFSCIPYGFSTLEDCINVIPELEIVTVNYDVRIRYASECDGGCTADSKMQLKNGSIPADKQKSGQDVPQRRVADESFRNFQKTGSPPMSMTLQRAFASGSQANVGGKKTLPPIVVKEIIDLVRKYSSGLSFQDFFRSYYSYYQKNFSYLPYGFRTLKDCIIAIPQLELVTVNYDLRIRFVSKSNRSCTTDSEMLLKNRSMPAGFTFVADTKKSFPEQQSSSVSLQTEFNKKEPSFKEHKSTTDLRDTGTPLLNSSDAKNKKITSSFGTPRIPEEVKHNLRKVMEKNQNGIWAKEFLHVYKVMTHEDLHLRTMGYQDLASFVKAAHDIMIPKTVPEYAMDWLIYPSQPLEEQAVGPSAANPKATARLVDSIILRIRKILQAYTEGVPLKDFLQIYCLNCGEPLYITGLGFDSLENFLRCIADRVPFKFQTDGACTSLHFVLPEEMVKSSVSLNQRIERAPPCSPSPDYRRTPKAPQGRPFPVQVLSVVDPGHLFIGLKGEDTSDAMLRMDTSMQTFYNECTDNRYVMGDFAIRIGAAAVARCSYDSRWYRVKVQSVSSEGSVQVFCVDYGFLKVVKKVSLRYISEEFLSLPSQALKARLANLRPPNNESKWNPQTKEIIESMCRDVPLLAQVLNISDGVHAVVLCDAGGQNSVGEKLMREGLAAFELSAVPQELPLGFQGASDPHQLLQMFWQAYFSMMDNMSPAASNFLLNPPSGDSSGALQNSPAESVEDSGDSQDDDCVLFDDDADSDFEDLLQKLSILTKRYVKRITSADGYRFHILIFESKPYVSSGDISTLIWSDKDCNYLQQRPQLKEYLWESVTLSDNEEMFEQFTRFHVKGCESNNGKSSVLVYPLESVIQLLNTFGHPSANLRTKILNERDSFNPLHPKWKELSEVEIPESDEEGCFGGTDDDKLNRLCLFDLQVMKEGIRVKSSKLKSGDPRDEEEKVKLQQLSERVVDRIDEIRHICSNFSSA